MPFSANHSQEDPMKCFSLSILLAFIFCLAPFPGAQAQGLLDLFGGFKSDSETKYRTEYVEGDKEAVDEVQLIRIHGVISDDDDQDTNPFEFRKSMMAKFEKDLETALKRDQVKAVLLDIDSPGGEVTAADVIYHKLSKLKTAKKPIVAIFGMLGASGAYYVACAADKIFAHPTSILGSIGVIIQTANVEKLADLIGFKSISLKSDRTPKKDILSPFRQMTPEERQMVMSIIDSMYDRFVKIVSDSRKKTVEEITKLADGGLYNADQALANGLIDGIGYREDAFAKAQEIAGLKTAKLVRSKPKRNFAQILGEIAEMHSGAPALLSLLQGVLAGGSTPAMKYQLNVGR